MPFRITLTYLVKELCQFFSEKIPRNYIPVNNKKKIYKACHTADLESAVEAAKEGMLYRKASKNFGKKKSTLHDFIRKGGVKSA